MSDRVNYDPPIKCWVAPSDDSSLMPLPALLHSETEHEVIVSEYDQRQNVFLPQRERRTAAHRDFAACRAAMFEDRREKLDKLRAEYQNAASICSHIDNLIPVAFPKSAFDTYMAEAFPRPNPTPEPPAAEEPAPEPAPSKPATQRPSRRRR